MKEVINSLIITLAVLTGAIFMKEKIKYWFYVLMFFSILLINLLFSQAHAREFDSLHDAKLEIHVLSEWIDSIHCLTADQRIFYEQKLKQHRFDAERTWNNAKNKCWYLPNKSNRDAAKNCFNAVMASFGGVTPMSKLVLSLISLLTSHGIDCIDEWYYIEEQLGWCQYHCEMVEFYLTVLEKG